MTNQTTGAVIELTTEPTEQIAIAQIKRAVRKHLADDRISSHTPEWNDVTVTEGPEKCGYGPLHVSGLVAAWNGYQTLRFALDGTGSRWEKYGHPSGTRYRISIRLEQQS